MAKTKQDIEKKLQEIEAKRAALDMQELALLRELRALQDKPSKPTF